MQLLLIMKRTTLENKSIDTLHPDPRIKFKREKTEVASILF